MALSTVAAPHNCKMWYLTFWAVSKDDAHRENLDDRSFRALAVQPTFSARRHAALELDHLARDRANSGGRVGHSLRQKEVPLCLTGTVSKICWRFCTGALQRRLTRSHSIAGALSMAICQWDSKKILDVNYYKHSHASLCLRRTSTAHRGQHKTAPRS